VLASAGLVAALARVRAQAPVSLELDAEGIGRYPSETESAVYYCCLEAIQNAMKHGGAGVHIRVTLVERDGLLRFRVADDGPGFRPGAAHGAGLQNMADRVGALGGRISVETAPGAGAVVVGQVPLLPAA
jgi:signal transduction histidine kinase